MSIFYAVSPQVQRVQKVQRVQRVQRVMVAASRQYVASFPRKEVAPLSGSAAVGSENQTTGLRPMEMHPFWYCAPLPPEGEVCSMLNINLIRCEQHFGDWPPPVALPLWCLRHHLSPAVRGHNTPRGTISPISISRHSAAKTSPSGGGAAAGGRRGAFPSRRRRGCMVFTSPEGRLYGFY